MLLDVLILNRYLCLCLLTIFSRYFLPSSFSMPQCVFSMGHTNCCLRSILNPCVVCFRSWRTWGLNFILLQNIVKSLIFIVSRNRCETTCTTYKLQNQICCIISFSKVFFFFFSKTVASLLLFFKSFFSIPAQSPIGNFSRQKLLTRCWPQFGELMNCLISLISWYYLWIVELKHLKKEVDLSTHSSLWLRIMYLPNCIHIQ